MLSGADFPEEWIDSLFRFADIRSPFLSVSFSRLDRLQRAYLGTRTHPAGKGFLYCLAGALASVCQSWLVDPGTFHWLDPAPASTSPRAALAPLFEVLSAFLVLRLVLVLPFVEVGLEPVVFVLLLQQPVPVRPGLFLLQRELDHPLEDGELGLLENENQGW